MYLPLIKPIVTAYKPFIKGAVLVGLTGTFDYSNNPYRRFEFDCLACVHICHIFLCLSMCACECNFARARLGTSCCWCMLAFKSAAGRQIESDSGCGERGGEGLRELDCYRPLCGVKKSDQDETVKLGPCICHLKFDSTTSSSGGAP